MFSNLLPIFVSFALINNTLNDMPTYLLGKFIISFNSEGIRTTDGGDGLPNVQLVSIKVYI